MQIQTADELRAALRRRKDELGLTWPEIARRLGVQDQKTPLRWCNGQSDPTPAQLLALLHVLGWGLYIGEANDMPLPVCHIERQTADGEWKPLTEDTGYVATSRRWQVILEETRTEQGPVRLRIIPITGGQPLQLCEVRDGHVYLLGGDDVD